MVQLAHLRPEATLQLVSDVSNDAIGVTRYLHHEAVPNSISLQRILSGAFRFFRSPLSFRPVIEGRQLIIFTNHYPLTCNQFTSDIRVLTGKDNTVTNTLSRLEVQAEAGVPTLHFEATAAAQENGVEIHNVHSSRTPLQLQKTLMCYCLLSLRRNMSTRTRGLSSRSF